MSLPEVLVVGPGPWAEQGVAVLTEHRVASPTLTDLDGAVSCVEGTGQPPEVVVLTVADPGDRLLSACAGRGVPLIDVHRSIASVDRARATWGTEAPPIVVADGWAGSAAAVAAVACRPDDEDPTAAERIEIDVLLAPGDEAAEEWWARFAGLHRSFAVHDRGQRRLVRGLGEPKVASFGVGRRRARRFASPEQETLVESGRAVSVAVRVAFARRSPEVWLALLVGSGAWRFLPNGWRRAVLRPPQGSAPHEIRVSVLRPASLVEITVVDPRGRAHLVAAAAAAQVARLLDPSRVPVPGGVTHPEQAPDVDRDLESLRRFGVLVEAVVHRA